MTRRMSDEEAMARAIQVARTVRTRTAPNPWVGALLLTTDGDVFEGATQPPGGNHAELAAALQDFRVHRGGRMQHLERRQHLGA